MIITEQQIRALRYAIGAGAALVALVLLRRKRARPVVADKGGPIIDGEVVKPPRADDPDLERRGRKPPAADPPEAPAS